MKNMYEVYTFSVDKNGEYIVTIESKYIRGYKEAKEFFENEKFYTKNEKHLAVEMRKLDDDEINELIENELIEAEK